jgi:hypothetical protein
MELATPVTLLVFTAGSPLEQFARPEPRPARAWFSRTRPLHSATQVLYFLGHDKPVLVAPASIYSSAVACKDVY